MIKYSLNFNKDCFLFFSLSCLPYKEEKKHEEEEQKEKEAKEKGKNESDSK